MLLYLIHAVRRIFIPYVIPCRIPALIRRKFRVHTAVKHGVPDVPRSQRVLVRRLIQRPHGVVLGRIVHAVVVDIAARPAEYPPPGQRKDRRQVAAVAKTFNTRKSVRHQQMGINYQQTLHNDDEITFMLYGGNREMLQYLAFKNNGVVQLERTFGGGELGWKRNTELFGLPVELASGITYNYQGEQRKGKDNEMGRKGQL